MATSNRISLDTDTVLLRRIYAFQGSGNIPVAPNTVLTTGADGLATFINPFITLQTLDPSYTGYLPDTISTIQGLLNISGEVSYAEFRDLSSHVSINTQTLADLSANISDLSASVNGRIDDIIFNGGVTQSQFQSTISQVVGSVNTLSTNIYTDLSAFSTGIYSYIATNPQGYLPSSQFSAYNASMSSIITDICSAIVATNNEIESVFNTTNTNISILSGHVHELSVFISTSTGGLDTIGALTTTVNNFSNQFSTSYLMVGTNISGGYRVNVSGGTNINGPLLSRVAINTSDPLLIGYYNLIAGTGQTLPLPAGVNGDIIVIKNTSSSNNLYTSSPSTTIYPLRIKTFIYNGAWIEL